ncbi:DUF531 domain-containing protein [archaeon]|nr:DUF531 domain-containing protein [archaeon]
MKNEKGNEASRYRALAREEKRRGGRHPEKLMEDARRLRDPYFVSLALFDLSTSQRLEIKKAFAAAKEALKIALKVESPWRRAELLGIIAKKAGSWGKERKYREQLLDKILKSVVSVPAGKGLSDAIKECCTSIGCARLGMLLEKASYNKGFELEDSRAVIHKWAAHCSREGLKIEDIVKILEKIENRATRSRLLGYLHIQCKKSKIPSGPVNPLQAAVEAALGAPAQERLDALQYLAKQSSMKEEMEVVAGGVGGLKDPANGARLLATLGGSADRAGIKEMALEFFTQGLRISSRIENPEEKAKVRLNLTKGLERCGDMEEEKSMKKEIKDIKVSLKEKEEGNGMLALYDTYEGGLKPVHARAVARAAPLCVAFGLDLALMGFPADNLEELVKTVARDTNVGKGGKYLKELARDGRVVLVPCTEREPPQNWDELGLAVAATSRPNRDKKIDMTKAFELAGKLHPKKRACIIMGLGKRGLPQSLLSDVSYHLELTGSGVELETATAMGIIAAQMAHKK